MKACLLRSKCFAIVKVIVIVRHASVQTTDEMWKKYLFYNTRKTLMFFSSIITGHGLFWPFSVILVKTKLYYLKVFPVATTPNSSLCPSLSSNDIKLPRRPVVSCLQRNGNNNKPYI